jgi:hypothetical protein
MLLLTGAAPAHAAFPADPPNDPLYDSSPLPNSRQEQWDLVSPAGGFDRGISVDRAWAAADGGRPTWTWASSSTTRTSFAPGR